MAKNRGKKRVQMQKRRKRGSGGGGDPMSDPRVIQLVEGTAAAYRADDPDEFHRLVAELHQFGVSVNVSDSGELSFAAVGHFINQFAEMVNRLPHKDSE